MGLIALFELETLQQRVDVIECFLDLCPPFSAGDDNLATGEDENHHFGSDHSEEHTGENVAMVIDFTGSLVVTRLLGQLIEHFFQMDGEFNIHVTDHVADSKVEERRITQYFLHIAPDSSGSQFGGRFAFGSSNHHFARAEDHGCGVGVTDSHDASAEPPRIVFDVAGSHCDLLQVHLAAQLERRHHI